MSNALNPAKLYIGAGELFFDRFDATTGAATGLRLLGNCSALEITPAEDEVRELYSSMEAARPLAARDIIRRKVTFKATLNEHSVENVALELMGNQVEYVQTATPVTGEVLSTAPVADRFYKTAKRKLTAVVVKRGAATLVLDTDYKIHDAEQGLIYLISGAGSGSLTIDYTPTVMTTGVSGLQQIRGAMATKIEGKLVYRPDSTRGPKFEIEVWKAAISPDGQFGLIQDEYGEFTLNAEVLSDKANHPNEPYYLVTERA
jgi:hypothetical protein